MERKAHKIRNGNMNLLLTVCYSIASKKMVSSVGIRAWKESLVMFVLSVVNLKPKNICTN